MPPSKHTITTHIDLDGNPNKYGCASKQHSYSHQHCCTYSDGRWSNGNTCASQQYTLTTNGHAHCDRHCDRNLDCDPDLDGHSHEYGYKYEKYTCPSYRNLYTHSHEHACTDSNAGRGNGNATCRPVIRQLPPTATPTATRTNTPLPPSSTPLAPIQRCLLKLPVAQRQHPCRPAIHPLPPTATPTYTPVPPTETEVLVATATMCTITFSDAPDSTFYPFIPLYGVQRHCEWLCGWYIQAWQQRYERPAIEDSL